MREITLKKYTIYVSAGLHINMQSWTINFLPAIFLRKDTNFIKNIVYTLNFQWLIFGFGIAVGYD